MSDQSKIRRGEPKPATGCSAKAPQSKGEWTVETLREFVKNYGWQIAVSQINAALAAQQIHNSAAQTRIVNLEQQFAAERKRLIEFHQGQIQMRKQQLREQLATEREKLRQANASYPSLKTEIQQLRDQLAAEREKYQRSQEKVKEYFDLLAAERELHGQQLDEARDSLLQLREQLAAAVEALKKIKAATLPTGDLYEVAAAALAKIGEK